ncbi:MAG TPA: DUF4233 domain-containing protein [Rugosimonospora sp.]
MSARGDEAGAGMGDGPADAAVAGDGPGEAAAAGGPDGEGPRSGLRNPAGAVRGVGAGTLVLEAIVLLLAIVPLTKLGVHSTGAAVGAVLALVVLCVVLAGLLRHPWAWYAGMVLQVGLFACGLFHIALAVLGVLFGAVWGYVLYVRRSVTG